VILGLLLSNKAKLRKSLQDLVLYICNEQWHSRLHQFFEKLDKEVYTKRAAYLSFESREGLLIVDLMLSTKASM
jgi:hypothetical protein